ncbi:MAG: NADH-quinone oxidoreductase subunit L [Chloroflexota bacterium]|jgi:NADH-quinone oxidoreductase subunit L
MSEELLTTFTWLIPAGPLLVFFLIVLFTNRNKTLSWLLAWAGVGLALFLGWFVALSALFKFLEDGHHFAEHPLLVHSAIEWLPIGAFWNWVKVGVSVDGLTAVALIMVTTTVSMIMVYSVGYHRWGEGPGKHPVKGKPNHDGVDPLFSRFMAFMSLFGGSMLILVISDNLLTLFIGWELMGLCSYLLIGFWYAKKYDDPKQAPPKTAAVKAFMTTRIGDVFMLLGVVFFYRVFGTLTFSEALSAHSLEHGLEAAGAGGLALMALLLFAGTVGKSAQWPLHVWLPDAMEGPTPVSAVIHAAAMVSAGVYLILRIFPLIAVAVEAAGGVSIVIGGIGAFTAVMAATIAVAQNDVKRVLAYSTISQLGYMVAAVGTGAYIAAAFHLITHGFFKALLFLGSGSIIHGMEHGAEHAHDHHTDPQDMMNMGGLRKKMPITFWTFVIGGFALSGFPIITAGFWSKDEILAVAWNKGAVDGESFALIVFIALVVGAILTAFYTGRQISLTFLGKPRTQLAEHAHESNAFMTVPLLVLSVFALFAGLFGVPEKFPVLGSLIDNNLFEHFVATTIEEPLIELFGKPALEGVVLAVEQFSYVPLALSVLAAVGGLFLGWWVYGRKALKAEQPDPLVRPLGPVYPFLKNKWYWDELYEMIFVNPTRQTARKVVYEWTDRGLIDGTLHLIARTVFRLGYYMKRFEEIVISGGVDRVKDGVLYVANEFRSLQSGRVQEYVVVSVIIGWFLLGAILVINLINTG